MGDNSAIEWTDATWNPVTGCTKISPGCKHCYAERLAFRLSAMGNPRYRNAFSLTLHRDLLDLPLKWRQPRRIFVNSMSDLFHEDIPPEYVKAVFQVMNRASWHNFQILTKRPERLAQLAPDLTWSRNIWQGVSVESPEYLWRIGHLRQVPAQVRFLSLEPLLAAIPRLPLKSMHWVIVGGESGPRRRPIEADWVRSIRDQCRSKRVPFFFKQWGGFNSKSGGCVLDGRKWQEWPNSAHTRPSSRKAS